MDTTVSVAAGTVTGAAGSPTSVSAGPAASIVQLSARNNDVWTAHTFTFTPNTTTTATISFANDPAGDGGDGVFLDNVSVTAAAIGGTTLSTTTLNRHSGTGTSSPYGTALSFDVTVAGNSGTPAGTVTLKDGGYSGTTLGSATLSNGSCTITTPTLALGTHSNIVAVYGGNSTYATSTSGPLSQTVSSTPPDTPVGLTATPGASGAIILTWNESAGATSYKISVKNTATNAEQLVTTTASPHTATGLTNGTLYQFKVLGTNSIGDSAYSGVVSATPTAGVSSTTTLAALSPSTYGNPVTFTATVAPVPTGGTVQFYDNNVALGSPVAVNTGTGVAQYTTSVLTAGSHPITATFSGTTGLIGSTASSKTQTVNKATPVVTVTGSTSFTYNASAQGPNTATTGGSTGAVTFSYVGVSGTTYPASGTPPTNVGSYTCTAKVAADSNYLSASSNATSFAIAKATPVITWSTPSPINVGTALGTTQLNATSGGVAGNFVYTPASGTPLALGSHTLSVQFTPTATANYNTPAATTVTIQVQPASSFNITVDSHNGDYPYYGASATDLINAGRSTLASLTLNPGSVQWDTLLVNLNDGMDPGGLGWTGFGPTDGAVVTAVLNTGTGGNAAGYDITSIISLTSNSDGADRISQKYDVAYHVVGGGATWTTVSGDAGATVARAWPYGPIGGTGGDFRGEMKVTLSGMTLTGVDQLRFTFHNFPNTAIWREIDVFGTATVAASNYATWAATQNPPLGDASVVGRDGLSNLLIYALDGLKTDHDNGSPGTLTGKRLSFAKRPAAVANKDVTYTIETSPDLGVTPWAAVSAGDPALTNTDAAISYTLPDGVPGGKVFARLKVSQ